MSDVIERVRDVCKQPYRPAVHGDQAQTNDAAIMTMMAASWNEAPEERPSFTALKQMLRKLNRGQ